MQFLDLAGLQALWNKIKAGDAAAKSTVESGDTASATAAYIEVNGAAVTGTGADGHTNYVVTLHNAASPTDITTAINTLKGDATSTGDTLGKLEDRVEGLESGSAVTITESAGSGDVLKVYTFRQGEASEENPDSNIIGAINIPKDFLVKSGTVEECTVADQPVAGLKPGDKYLDFVVNATDGAGTESHIYIPVQDLVDVYKSGKGINVGSDNTISAVVDPAADNEFLSVSDSGLKVSGVSTAISNAVDAAKAELIGNSETDNASSDTIEGAKKYADSIVSAKNVTATGDSYVSASASNNEVTVAASDSTKASLALADSALQGVDTTPAGTNVQVTLGKNGKNVTVSVVETGLTEVLAKKADKVDSATAGNFAGLDVNGNLTDSGKKAADFAIAAQGAKADTAIQNVTGETAVDNSNYVKVSVEAAKTGTDVALTSHANVTTHTVSDAVVGTADGLATAADVKSYVDGQKSAVDTAIANMDADLDASGTPAHGGVFVMSGVTQVDGKLTSVDSQEVEVAGAAAAAEARLRGASTDDGYVADETLAKLRKDIDAMGGAAGSIAQQIATEIGKLDSDVNVASEASDGHVLSNNKNTVTKAAETSVANVLTSLTITDGKISAATGETIGAIPLDSINTVLNS